MTEDVVAYFNQHTGMNLTPIFNQYLRHAHIPRLELLFGEAPGMVMYKWDADEDDFAMPVKVGTAGSLADHPSHHEVAVDAVAAIEGRLPGRSGRVLRRREQAVTWRISAAS